MAVKQDRLCSQFVNLQMALQDLRHLAACRKDFPEYVKMCCALNKKYGTPMLSGVKDQDASWYQVDKVSLQIMPDSYKPPYLPVRSTGDGNCLFNSASLAICQDEELAVELRLRTCLELALNQEYYKEHHVLKEANIKFHSRKYGIGVLPMESLFDLALWKRRVRSHVQE